MALTPGSRVGPYEITALLGEGGMGQVYRARDPRLHREVALKVLPAEFSTDPSRKQRFEQEAQAVAALNHPGIVSVYDVGDGWMVTELGRQPWVIQGLMQTKDAVTPVNGVQGMFVAFTLLYALLTGTVIVLLRKLTMSSQEVEPAAK